VMVGAWEVLDHFVDGIDIEFPDAAWFDVVGTAVSDAVEIAGAEDTLVALLSVPCMQQGPDSILPTLARNDPARIAAFNAILQDEAAARPNVHVVDLGAQLCPEGTYLEEVDGAQVRYDGVHLTPGGANFVWTWLVDELASLQKASSTGEVDSIAPMFE
jgi:hypothetical protein